MTGPLTFARRSGIKAGPLFILSAIALITVSIGLVFIGSAGATAGVATFAVPVVLALVPVAAVVAFRWPLIFPFGLWAALVPFDFILAAGPAGLLTRLLAFMAAGMIALRIIVTRRMLSAPDSWLPWLVLVGWMTVTALWTIGPVKTQAALGAILPLFVMMTVVAIYPVSVKEMRGVLFAIVAGSLCAAAFGLNMYAHGQLVGDGRVSLTSDTGLVVDANFFATSFLLPISICLSVALAHRAIFMRVLAGSSIFAMVAAIFLSGSRGAFISVGVVFVYYVVKSRNRLALLAIAAGTGLSFVLFPAVLNRLNQNQTLTNGSGRTFIWSVGAKALGDHYHWLTGAGVGTFPVAYDKALNSVFQPIFEGWSRPAHNVLVGTSVELGLFGVAVLVFAWWRSFRQAAVIEPTSSNYPLRLASEAAMFGLFVNALFIDPLLIKYYWLAFMIPMMLHNVERPKNIRQRRPVSTQAQQTRVRRALLSVPRVRNFGVRNSVGKAP